jgi:hypothetical protein
METSKYNSSIGTLDHHPSNTFALSNRVSYSIKESMDSSWIDRKSFTNSNEITSSAQDESLLIHNFSPLHRYCRSPLKGKAGMLPG